MTCLQDVTLALIEWVEKGREPNEFIASTYVENDINRGVASQRPICAYPRVSHPFLGF